MGRNLGWIGAQNYALSRFQPDFYFFLNPDALVQGSWLRPLINTALGAGPRVAAVAPKFHYPDGSIQSAGFQISSLYSVEPRGFGQGDRGQFDLQRTVPLCSGMMLLSAQAARDIGPVDPGFGLGYFEDIDYSLRAQYLGYSIAFAPDSLIVHGEGKSFERLGDERKSILVQNRLRLITLHWPTQWLLVRACAETFKPVQALLRGQNPIPILRGWLRWAASLPDSLRLRHRHLRSRKAFPMAKLMNDRTD